MGVALTNAFTCSFKSAREAMAMGELGCQHATIPEDILLQLSMMSLEKNPPPGESPGGTGVPSQRLARLAASDPLAAPDWNGELASTKIDYLRNNGEALQKAISSDEVTKKALHGALDAFKQNELQSKAAIEEVMRQV
jgi:transaldolase